MPRTALVTGGASGLGAASAARLRADGLTVTTLDLSGPADITADVTDEAALREVAGRIGPVDVLVNSAGIVGANKPLLDTTTQEWQHVLDVNVLGIVNAMRVFVPGMCDRGWGRVVNLASMAGKDGNPNLSIYSASKALGIVNARGFCVPGVCARGRGRVATRASRRARAETPTPPSSPPPTARVIPQPRPRAKDRAPPAVRATATPPPVTAPRMNH